MHRLRLAAVALALLAAPWAAKAQLACNTGLSQTALLTEFSDNAAIGSITPANVRDIICNVLISTFSGAVPTGWLIPNTQVTGFTTSLAGDAKGVSMALTTPSANGVITAEQVVVATALNGSQFKLNSYSQTLNLAVTGAGGMDVGSAPNTGYVAIYAIYNPTTVTTSVLGTNATSSVATTIYSGSNLPSGFTYSALLSVWPTNSSLQFIVGTQHGRTIQVPEVTVLSTTTPSGSPASISLTTAVPPNATSVQGNFTLNNSGGSTSYQTVLCSSTNTTICSIGKQVSQLTGATVELPFSGILLTTAQTIAYAENPTGGSSPYGATMTINGYGF